MYVIMNQALTTFHNLVLITLVIYLKVQWFEEIYDMPCNTNVSYNDLFLFGASKKP